MSRGVVLWPDAETSRAVVALWASLETGGIPTLASHTHAQHRPHVSLVVADGLFPQDALGVLGPLPQRDLSLTLNSAGVFPGGTLFLTPVPTSELLEEQQRVHRLVTPLTKGLWSYFEPRAWTPHVTISYDLDGEQLGRALPMVLDHLPIVGWLTSGGVEDGDSGERWLAGEANSRRILG